MAALTGAGTTLAVVAAGFIPGQAQASTPTPAPSANPAHAAESVAKSPGPLRLQAGTWQPATQAPPAVKNARQARALQATGSGLHIVQFNGAIRPEWAADVRKLGARMLTYLPDNAYLVRMTPEQAAAAKQLDSVSWVGRYQGDWKLTRGAKAQATKVEKFKPGVRVSASNPNRGRYTVTAAEDAVQQLEAAVKSTGAIVYQKATDRVVVIATAAQLDALAASEVVESIDEFVERELHNEDAQGVIMRGNVANTRGYDGRTQIGSVIDTGFATGSAATGTAAVPPKRIVGIESVSAPSIPDCTNTIRDGAQDVDSGHGTHTATTVFGQGDKNGVGKAAAHAARMIFVAVEDFSELIGPCANGSSGWYSMGGLADPAKVIADAALMGARVSSNSWGSPSSGAYTSDSSAVDKKVATLRKLTVVMSAGNEGSDRNRDGAVDEGSMASPATAKNVIAVGASETRRDAWACDPSLTYPSVGAEGTWLGKKSCQQLGGKMGSLPSWGAFWPSSFPVDPLKSDNQSDDPDQMAAFSSRGPTTDGRIKPEVVAPGSWILSGYSPMFQQGYGATVNPQTKMYQDDGYGLPFNQDYKYASGTSMSAPAVAGGALVVRDYLLRNYNIDASAALVKTALVNSAVDLLDENNDGPADNAKPIPNNDEGWGRVDLDNATRGTATYVDEGVTLGLGQVHETLVNSDGSAPLKVSMAWTDPAAAQSADPALVNNLNLSLISPSGVVYLGNDFEGGWTVANGERPDGVNNLENVYVQKPEAGQWRVRVFGANVPTGSQMFAMTIDGGTSRMAKTTAPVVTNPGQLTFTPGRAISRKIQAFDPGKLALTYSASGLPLGFTLDPATGVLSGQATTRTTDSQVTLVVTNAAGKKSQITFWMRAATPSVAPTGAGATG